MGNKKQFGLQDLPITVYLAVAGAAMAFLAWRAGEKGLDSFATPFAIAGAGAILIAPVAGRIKGFKFGSIEVDLRERLATLAEHAPLEEIEAILPLLEDRRIGIRRFLVPDRLEGKKLTDQELSHLRPSLKISVIAIRLPGDARWMTGGEISDLKLPAEAFMLAAGPRKNLDKLEEELSA